MKLNLNAVALSVSVFALAISTWQAIMLNKSLNLSVEPFVQATPYLEGAGGRNGIYVSNIGLGPAIFNGAQLIIDDKEYDLSNDVWEKAMSPIKIDDLCFSRGWIPVGAGLAKEEEKPLLEISRAKLIGCELEIFKLLSEHKVSIRFSYESMLKKTHTKVAHLEVGEVKKDVRRYLNKLTQ